MNLQVSNIVKDFVNDTKKYYNINDKQGTQ